MIITGILLIPILGLLLVGLNISYSALIGYNVNLNENTINMKSIALKITILTLLVSIFAFIVSNLSSNQFQFVQEYNELYSFNLHMGTDGLSIYFVLLTAIIIPISLLSNWTSIAHSVKAHVMTIVLLNILLLIIFLALESFSFYIYFESILPPLFMLIGIFGSEDRVRAGFYLFLYTLLGSLFLLLSIIAMSSQMGYTDFDSLYKINFEFILQLFFFGGIFIAFAVKTPTIFLNTWLLKAHVESPLSGSIILAAIVLKLSLYGILRLILPSLPKAYLISTYIIFLIGVLTILYASVSTIRTMDVKELIAYSSVCHAAVYLIGVFSDNIQGIEGAILLGLSHGFVSSGLFICAGGVLYDRSSTRLITNYRGIAQLMPVFSILFFMLCLGNCGAPLTLNFVGEFLSLYGAFERLPLLGVLGSTSIIFSAAYTIYMFNRISFGGAYSKYFFVNISDLNKREFYMLITLVTFTVVLGIYPNFILDGLHYSVSTVLYSSPWAMCFIPFFKPLGRKVSNKRSSLHIWWLEIVGVENPQKLFMYSYIMIFLACFILKNTVFCDTLYAMPSADTDANICSCGGEPKGPTHTCDCDDEAKYEMADAEVALFGPEKIQGQIEAGHNIGVGESDAIVTPSDYCCGCGQQIQEAPLAQCQWCNCIYHKDCYESNKEAIDKGQG